MNTRQGHTDMSLRSILSLILSLQLAWGRLADDVPGNGNSSTDSSYISAESKSFPFTTDPPAGRSSNTANKEVTQQPRHEMQCGWWCEGTLGIAISAGLGGIFLIAIIMCTASCCMWRRRRTHPVMKEMELEALTQDVTAECSVTLPGDSGKTETVTPNDNGFCDVENCISEAIQDSQDLENNLSSPEFNLPEPPDVPPLAE